jgi:signal transduction histidine kinase
MIRGKWRSAPVAVFGSAILILLAGIGIILQYNVSYAHERMQQAQGLADILAASEAAPLDFDDPVAAQESVNAFRVNAQVRLVGVYDREGKAVAGYQRSGAPIPATISDLPEAQGNVMRVSAAVEKAGQRIGTVYFDVDREAGARRFTRYALMFVLAFVAALVVTGLGIAQTQLRSANRELTDRADALAQANELLEEQMEERAKAEDQLRQSQKMQALGQLTGGIAHDFNNLLTVIQGSADMLCKPELPESKRVRFAKAIVQASNNAASLTSQLLSFARRQPLKPEQVDLNSLIVEMEDLIDRTIGERIELSLHLRASGCTVEVDKAQLQSAILNVASNAAHAMPDGGSLTVRTRKVDENGRSMIALEIADTGRGMDPDILDRAFEPFFTTKGTGKGTGLGLSQVYGFVTQSGGEAAIESRPGQGTVVTLMLPCVRSTHEDASAEHSATSAAELPTSSILVVEDNADVAAFAEALLTELGHKVTRASSGEEALDLARTRDFDIVFSDVVMPGMGGLKLAEILAKEKPELPVVLATGYSQQVAETGTGGRPVILKPYRLGTLSEALSQAIRAAQRA